MYSFGRKTRKHSKRSGRKRSGRKRSGHKRSKSIKRVGNKVIVNGRGGKQKTLKVKKNSQGREYYVSGKRKTKHFLSSNRVRSFGNKGSLLNIMGNFQPPAQMSLAQSTTGFSAPQMNRHMSQIARSDLSNFYNNIP